MKDSCRGSKLRLVTFVLFLSSFPVVGAEGAAPPAMTIKQAERKLQHRDPDEVAAAVECLKSAGEKARDPLVRGLTRRLDTLGKKRGRLESDLRHCLSFRDRAVVIEALDGLFREHQRASKALLAIAFDSRRYPYPESMPWRPGVDVQRGQLAVEIHVVECLRAFNDLETALGQALRVKLGRHRRSGGEALLERRDDPHADTKSLPVQKYRFTPNVGRWIRLLGELERTARTRAEIVEELEQTRAWLEEAGQVSQEEEGDALVESLYALAARDYDTADEISDELEGVDQRLFDFLTDQAMLRVTHEDLVRAGWEAGSVAAVEINNLYRIGVGLRPLIPNAKLRAAAEAHAAYQDKIGVMTHEGIDDATASPSARAGREGYSYGVAENIGQICSGRAGCIWAWRTDSAHHLNLINPAHRAVGVAMVKGRHYPTWNTGPVAEHPIEVLM